MRDGGPSRVRWERPDGPCEGHPSASASTTHADDTTITRRDDRCIEGSESRCSPSGRDLQGCSRSGGSSCSWGSPVSTSSGTEVSFTEPQWGQAIWAGIIAAIWFWVAAGFWGVRAYAWQFGIFISLFTMIFGFFSILASNTTTEFEMIGWLLVDRHLLLPELPGRPRELREERDVPPDPGAARRGRGGEPGQRRRAQAMATPAPAAARSRPQRAAPRRTTTPV